MLVFFNQQISKIDALYKKTIDFTISLDFYGLKDKNIKTFQQFIIEKYDSEDLIFYLLVRSCIEKELKVFLEKAKENLGQGLLKGQGNDDDILVPVIKCKKFAKAIYGNEEEELMSNFMDNIKKLLEINAGDEKKKYLKADFIVNISLANYHDSRGKVIEEVNIKKMIVLMIKKGKIKNRRKKIKKRKSTKKK